jgi:hypothetical protein
MTHIGMLIKEWIESWTECYYCNYMVRSTYYSYDNKNKVICKECINKE